MSLTWPSPLHSWDIRPADGVQLQRQLAQRVAHTPLTSEVRWAVGTDAAFGARGRQARTITAAAILYDMDNEQVCEQNLVVQELHFPYVPGLLSFREAPAVIDAVKGLSVRPDVILVDGQGTAHPRRLGLACHVGLFLDVPTVGCAKSILCGRPAGDLSPGRGAQIPLLDNNEQIGTVVRTRDNVKPVYVSVGHRITLHEAVQVVLSSTRGYKLPEPNRQAHLAVQRAVAR